MNARLEVQPNAGSHILVPPIKLNIAQNAEGWIRLERSAEWVDIPPDNLLRPYGPDLPTPERPQNITIGRWLKGTAS